MPTILAPGDIAIIALQADNPDFFAFVPLVDLEAGTEILFTDNGVFENGAFRTNEGVLTYTAPAAISAGTVVSFNGAEGAFAQTSGSFALSTGGDQVIAFQGTVEAPVFLFAAQSNSTLFQTTADDSNTSALPTGLVVGETAVAAGAGAGDRAEFDNIYYDASNGVSGSKAELLALIADASNWTGSNTPAAPDFPAFTVEAEGGDDAAPSIVINEVDADTPSTDVAEFIELYDGGVGNVSLDGLVVVLFNGSDDASYAAFDLDGFATDSDGFFVIGNDGLAEADLTIGASNVIQNGADAVALFTGDAADFPNDTPVTNANLIDAVVYDSSDADDAALLDTLTPGQPQINDDANDNDGDVESISRVPDGTGAFVVQAPTPGASNVMDDDDDIGGDEPVLTLISAVQGDGAESPLIGQTVIIEGVVVGDHQDDVGEQGDLDGFFVQEQRGDEDGDAATSEGVFVFQGSNPAVNVALGDVVRVTGTVSEFFGKTQITADSVLVDGVNGLDDVDAADIVVGPDVTDADYEAVEGMLVSVTSATDDPLTVTANFNLDRFGELQISAGAKTQPTQLFDAQTQADQVAALGAANDANTLFLDDGFTVQNPTSFAAVPNNTAGDDGDGILDAEDDFSFGGTLRLGAEIVDPITGVMDFSFGEYKVLPNAPIAIDEATNQAARDFAPDPVGGDVQVASVNVLNYFSTLDLQFVTLPNGTDPRGADNADELARQTQKLVEQLTLIEAEVLAIQELGNDGFGPDGSIATLATELSVFSERDYAFVDPTGAGDDFIGTDAITTGIVYDADAVTLLYSDFLVFEEVSAATTFALADVLNPFASSDDQVEDFQRNRPAVAATFEDNVSGEVFTVASVHFKSKGDSNLEDVVLDAARDGAPQADIDALIADPNYDQNDGQGFWNQVRLDAAIEVEAWLTGDYAAEAVEFAGAGAAENILLLGDFNAYAQEDPTQAVRDDADFIDVIETVVPGGQAEAYSFVFDGERGTLDQAFASTAIAEAITGATEWHVNADEPDLLNYDFSFNDARFFAPDQFAASDHDPLIIGLDFSTPAPAPAPITVERVARSEALGDFDESAAESIAHEGGRFFVTNSDKSRVDVLEQDPANPSALISVGALDVDGGSDGGPNSVAVKGGVVAVAVGIANEVDDDEIAEPGVVALFDAQTLEPLAELSLGTGAPGEGVLPDMLTFSADGSQIFVAIEGEPDDVSDAKGGLSVITLDSDDLTQSTVEFFGFEAFDAEVDALREAGVRIFPEKLPSTDFEPEYIAVDPQTGDLRITLQEANALAVFSVTEKRFTAIQPLGLKDHGVEGNGIDPSDRDDAIAIAPQPGVVGMYMPDAIASYVAADGQTYFVTANEGDARNEDDRVRDLDLDPTAFPDAEALQENENLGRLEVSTIDGDTDGDGDFDQLFAYGSRSFSIYDADGNQVFDSGDDFEQIIAAQTPALFNANNDGPFDFDSRSDAKGPEPEAVAVASLGEREIAVIGLERANGLMFYDVTDVTEVTFLGYRSTAFPDDKLVSGLIEDTFFNSDLGPEVIVAIDAADSATGRTQIAVSNEVSGTVSVYDLEAIIPEPPAFTLELLHFGDQEANAATIDNIDNLSGVLNALRAQDLGNDGLADNSLTLSSGDAIIPGLFFDASAAVFGGEGVADIQIQNELGVQAIALGNHEFDLGTELLGDLISGTTTVINDNGTPDDEGDDFAEEVAFADFEALEGSALEGSVFTGSEFPYLSANLTFASDANLAPLAVDGGQAPQAQTVTSSTVIDVNGEPIGVVGATVPTIRSISSPGPDLGIAPAWASGSPTPEELQALADIIQAEVDALLDATPGLNKVVLLSHMQQISIEEGLAALLTGVDIIVAGGSNTRLFDENDRIRDGDSAQGVYPTFVTNAGGSQTAVVNTDGNYKYVGRLVLEFDENGEIVADSYDADVSGAFATDDQGVADLNAEGLIDPEIDAITGAIQERIVETESNVFGVSDVFLTGNRSGTFTADDTDGVRTQETNLGNLTADANLAYANQMVEENELGDPVLVSIKNGGGIRANIGQIVVPAGGDEAIRVPNEAIVDADGVEVKPVGGISQNDIATALSFNNGLVLVDVTRAELKAFLEGAIAALPNGVSGGFPQIAGLRFSFDETRTAQTYDQSGAIATPGERVENAAIVDETGAIIAEIVRDGELAGDPSEPFRVVTLNFLANAGDEILSTLSNPNRVDLQDLDGDGSDDGAATGAATFADDGSEQDALAEFLNDNFNPANGGVAFTDADTGPALDARIQNLTFRQDTIFPEDSFAFDFTNDGAFSDGNDRLTDTEGDDVIGLGGGRRDIVTLRNGGEDVVVIDQDAALNEVLERVTILTEQGFTLVVPDEITPLEALRGSILTVGLDVDGAALDQVQVRFRGDATVDDVTVLTYSEFFENGLFS